MSSRSDNKTKAKAANEVSGTHCENYRTGMSVSALKQAFFNHLYYTQGRLPEIASRNDFYMSIAHAVRDRLLTRWISTVQNYLREDVKLVSYLSAEFLMGPQLGSHLISLGIYEQAKEALQEAGLDLNDLLEQEEEPGLGNGGLGRLAACYLDSLATLAIPAIGYGIRYEYGIFDQEIRDGWQVEVTDKWLALGNPWEIPRPEIAFYVKMGGHTEGYHDDEGSYRITWVPERVIKGIAYDSPVPGYGVNISNLLRLWKSEACESFDFQAFNTGDYYRAVDEKVVSENITKVLYPNDEPAAGKKLRLMQQYFFVSCSLQDMIRIHLLRGKQIDTFHEKFAVQLNDTHPAVGVAELMRLLVDDHAMDWERAWHITRNTFAYTNHTLLPEALEKWSLPLFRSLLPRHLELIYEINRRFLEEVRMKYPDDGELISRMSLIDETGEKSIRMAHLASVGSHAINGVAALHTELLKQNILHDFCELYPDKVHNITNGVTPRRWIVLSNPRLSALITSKIGDTWIHKLEELKKLEKYAGDQSFMREWREVKRENKADLAGMIEKQTGIVVDADSLFDIQVKRIHEYKRQHLSVLHIIELYRKIKDNPGTDIIPRTFIFGGKAAPGYFMAKLIIKLINSVADIVNNDRDVAGRLKVVFFPDFNVKKAHWIYPAADLSEQISTAGKEASGTGNMKFSMNGALTIGTLDGANVEIREEVGEENFFLFGLTAPEVQRMKSNGYNPRDFYNADPRLREVIDLIGSGFFSHGDGNLFRPLVDSLLYRDEYLVLADYRSYSNCQKEVETAYRNRDHWTVMSILNSARMGKFSSDRSIGEYCETIWNTKPLSVDLKNSPLGQGVK